MTLLKIVFFLCLSFDLFAQAGYNSDAQENPSYQGQNKNPDLNQSQGPSFQGVVVLNKDDCLKDKNRRWNETQNRCVSIDAAPEIRSQFVACEQQLPAEASEQEVVDQERKTLDCFLDIVKHIHFSDGDVVLNDKENNLINRDRTGIEKAVESDGLIPEFENIKLRTMNVASAGVSVLALAFAGINHFTAHKLSHCTTLGYKLMAAGAALSILGETTSLIYFKIQGDKIKNEINESKEKSSLKLQEDAFWYYEQEQKHKGISEAIRAGTYLAATVLHGAAAVFSAMNLANADVLCSVAGDEVSGAAKAAPAMAAAPALPAFQQLIKASPLVGSLVLIGLTGMIGGVAANAAKVHFENAKKLLEIKDVFMKELRSSGFRCDDRNDPANPDCYCYTDAGEKNPLRVKSKICEAYYNSKSKLWGLGKAQDFRNTQENYNPEGCVNRQGSFDRKCDCKKRQDTLGNNNCMTLRNAPVAGMNLMNQDLMKSTVNTVDSMGQGTYNAGLADNFSNQSLSAKILQGLKPLLGNVAGQGEIAGLTANQFENLIRKSALEASPAQIKSAQDLAQLDQAGWAKDQLPESFVQLKDKVDQQIVPLDNPQGSDLKYSDNGSKKANVGNAKDKLAFLNFADEGSKETQNANFEQADQSTNYDFKNVDIHQHRDDQSLFEIISDRYIKSGLKSLFNQSQ